MTVEGTAKNAILVKIYFPRKIPNDRITPKEVYLYLSLLSIFEVETQKRQACFVSYFPPSLH